MSEVGAVTPLTTLSPTALQSYSYDTFETPSPTSTTLRVAITMLYTTNDTQQRSSCFLDRPLLDDLEHRLRLSSEVSFVHPGFSSGLTLYLEDYLPWSAYTVRGPNVEPRRHRRVSNLPVWCLHHFVRNNTFLPLGLVRLRYRFNFSVLRFSYMFKLY